ncbi:MAG: DnaA/Hda family protein [Planctomycetota bacterium]|nr:DnaA/Hda family protein [Planctomycetota bacterium]
MPQPREVHRTIAPRDFIGKGDSVDTKSEKVPQNAVQAVNFHDLPAKYIGYRIHEYGQIGVKAKAWLDKPLSNLYLHGLTGGRKTSLAIATLIEYRQRWANERYQKWLQRFDNWSEYEDRPAGGGIFLPMYDAVGIFRDFKTDAALQARARFRSIDLLIIDDIGKHRQTDHIVETLVHIFHARHDQNKRTIITSNMTLQECGNALGEATARRIAEGVVLKMDRVKK